MTVRVGVIGGGIWGNYHLSAIKNLENDGKAKLVAVATRTEASAKKHRDAFNIKGYTDYKKMIEVEGLDAVTIATPDHLHLEMALYALEKGSMSLSRSRWISRRRVRCDGGSGSKEKPSAPGRLSQTL